MKRVTSVLAMAAMLIITSSSARGQFEPGKVDVRPQFGFGIGSSFGITAGAAMTYSMSDRMAFGPSFYFSTAGRSWKSGEGDQAFETKGSNSMVFAGQVYYLFTPDSDYPWYVNGGAGIVKFGSVTETDGGAKLTYGGAELEIKGATVIAFNIGGGTIYKMSDTMSLVIDVNSYIGSQGDRKGKTANQDDIDLNDTLEGGSFWLLHSTVGLSFTF